MHFKRLSVLCLVGLSACASEEEATGWAELEEGQSALMRYNTRTEIRSEGTQKCVDIPWGLPSALPVNQFTCHRGPAQQFSLQQAGPGLFTLRNASSGKCVTLGAYNRANRSYPLVQTTCNPLAFYQSFYMAARVDTPTGARAALRSANDSGVCIDVPGGVVADSFQLQAFPCHFGPNQMFTLTQW